MSQTEADIQSWIQTGVGVITAMGVLYSIHQGMRTRRAAHQAVAAIQTVAENVDRVEKATNSMMASGAEAGAGKGRRRCGSRERSGDCDRQSRCQRQHLARRLRCT